MSAKVRILTRRFDLAVEGENVEEVERLIEFVEKRGLQSLGQAPTVPTGVVPRTNLDAQVMAMDVGAHAGGPVTPSLASFDGPELGGPITAHLSATSAPEIGQVTKRMNDVLVLSPKFPPNADGSERYDAAALVLLGGYDVSGEVPITGGRLLKSLRNTGYALDRADRQLENLVQKGVVLVEGIRKGRKYSLSESGRVEARRLALELADWSGKKAGSVP